MTSLESFIVNMGHSISNCQAHKLLCHDLWEELYVLGLRSDATLCNREILVGQQPWYSKKAWEYRQHRRGTFLTNFNETPFAAV
jgi:hypothetical protein